MKRSIKEKESEIRILSNEKSSMKDRLQKLQVRYDIVSIFKWWEGKFVPTASIGRYIWIYWQECDDLNLITPNDEYYYISRIHIHIHSMAIMVILPATETVLTSHILYSTLLYKHARTVHPRRRWIDRPFDSKREWRRVRQIDNSRRQISGPP